MAEDEVVIALDLGETLHALGCVLCTATASGPEVLDLVRRERPDVVLLDLGLVDGFAGPRAEDVPFVLSTGHLPEVLADLALREAPVLRKPYGRAELLRALGRAVAR